MLRALDIFFFAFHTVFMCFVLFGWMARKTRKAQLAAVLATAFSWFFLGIWYGFGFCFCTEWHWRLRERLGYTETTDSYIEFLVEAVTPLGFQPRACRHGHRADVPRCMRGHGLGQSA